MCRLFLNPRQSRIRILRKDEAREVGLPLPNGEKRPCYFYLVKRSCRNGKDCPFSQDTKLRDKAEKAGPPKSRSASPKGRGDKVCRDFQKGNCKRGDKCPYSHKSDKPAAPAIKIAVTSTASGTIKKNVSFFNAIQTKQFIVPVKEMENA